MRALTKAAICLFLIVVMLVPPVSSKDAESAAEAAGGYMTEKEGFRYVQVRGSPDEIGYQHGTMLWETIEQSLAGYAHATEDWNKISWSQARRQGQTYWHYVPDDMKAEIQGIAMGANEMGAKNPLGDPVDWIDILTLNAIWDLWWRISPRGNPFWWLPGQPVPVDPLAPKLDHCSAFVATGSATKDGGFVISQSLWMPYFIAPSHAVFMDIIPETGNRIFMEVTAGMIWSGTEYYINSAGLVIAETTIGNGPYIWGGIPSFIRLRKAAQYADSIDSFKDIMLTDTNGAYCGDYLLADAETNEVAVLELGSRTWAIKRTMDGFLQSCNYEWDDEVAKELGAPRGWDHGCYPRWVRFDQFKERDWGNITAEIGIGYLGDHYDTVEERENACSHTICGHVDNASGYPHGSIDAKSTNRTMAMRLETLARYGHSCGTPFIAADHAAANPDYAFDDLHDIIPGRVSSYGAFSKVSVLITDDDGDPISGATVNFTSLVDGSSFELVTDDSGSVLVEYTPSSLYAIRAEKGSASADMEIAISDDEDITMSISSSGKGFIGGIGTGAGIVVFVALAAVAGGGGYYAVQRRMRKPSS
jgi:hypothetical protein